MMDRLPNISRGARRVFEIGALLLLGCNGCYQSAFSHTFEDSRRFQHQPGSQYRTQPVARVDEMLYGFNLFGISVKPLDPVSLQRQYLKDPHHSVANWQVVTGTIDIPYLQFLFTVPFSRVTFDVVDVEGLGR